MAGEGLTAIQAGSLSPRTAPGRGPSPRMYPVWRVINTTKATTSRTVVAGRSFGC